MMKQQNGFFLLEALIAIVIFTIGVLGIIGLEAAATRNATASISRVTASQLAQSYISQLQMAHTLNAGANWYNTYVNNTTSGSPFVNWQSQVNALLPGSTQTVAITAATLPGTYQATVTITWSAIEQNGTSTVSHQLIMNTQV